MLAPKRQKSRQAHACTERDATCDHEGLILLLLLLHRVLGTTAAHQQKFISIRSTVSPPLCSLQEMLNGPGDHEGGAAIVRLAHIARSLLERRELHLRNI